MKLVTPFAIAALLIFAGCGTSASMWKSRNIGFLRFEVEPEHAELEVDEKYSGQVQGWADGVVPVEPGFRRVTVRAEGFITQRFDIEVGAGEEVTLEIRMERSLEIPDESADPRPGVRERLRASP